MLSVRRSPFKRAMGNSHKRRDKLADDLASMLQSMHVDEIDNEHSFNVALKENDIITVLNFVQTCKALPMSVESCRLLGRHGNQSMIAMLNGNCSFSHEMFKEAKFNSLFEGIASSDNFQLLRYLTATCYLRSVTQELWLYYVTTCIDTKACKCLDVLLTHISQKNDQDSRTILKYGMSRAIESGDSRVISIVLETFRPMKTTTMTIEYNV